MPVHSLHIFDRRGKTLFSKRYIKDDTTAKPEELSEQRKLVFGMLFSLREIVASLTPESPRDGGLHAVKTAASTLYNYETASGLRFALYVTNFTPHASSSGLVSSPTSSSAPSGVVSASPLTATAASAAAQAASIRNALWHIYNELWIQCVTRSPLYRIDEPNVPATNFEQNLDAYLVTQNWFR